MILHLLNNIIDNVNCLSAPQTNTALATVVYKQKSKPIFQHKSHRLVRVLPLIGRIFDEFVRPNFRKINKPLQNPNQYGFTEGISSFWVHYQDTKLNNFALTTRRLFSL